MARPSSVCFQARGCAEVRLATEHSDEMRTYDVQQAEVRAAATPEPNPERLPKGGEARESTKPLRQIKKN